MSKTWPIFVMSTIKHQGQENLHIRRRMEMIWSMRPMQFHQWKKKDSYQKLLIMDFLIPLSLKIL
nr:MAG TPA_asm: hypothetical protein [Caudoviricetes sp.]